MERVLIPLTEPQREQVRELVPFAERVAGWFAKRCRWYASDIRGSAMVAMCEAVACYDPNKGNLKEWVRTWIKAACRESLRHSGQRAIVPRGAREFASRQPDIDNVELVRVRLPAVRAALSKREWAVLAAVSGIDGEPVTGADLAKRTGVTRAAISLVVVRAKAKAAELFTLTQE